MPGATSQQPVITLTICVLALGTAVFGSIQEGAGAGAVGWQPPIVDDESRGLNLPNGDVVFQSQTVLDPGRRTDRANPPCIGSHQPDAAAECATLCVHQPDGAKVTSITTLGGERGPNDVSVACDSEQCLGTTVASAKMTVEPGNPRLDQDENRVCRVFKNWSPERRRDAALLVSFDLQGYPVRLLHERVSDQIADLWCVDTSKVIQVRVEGKYWSVWPGTIRTVKPLDPMNIKVWVLRADGSSLRYARPPSTGTEPGLGAEHEVMTFFFERAPLNDLTAVVLRIGDEVLVRPVQSRTSKYAQASRTGASMSRGSVKVRVSSVSSAETSDQGVFQRRVACGRPNLPQRARGLLNPRARERAA